MDETQLKCARGVVDLLNPHKTLRLITQNGEMTEREEVGK